MVNRAYDDAQRPIRLLAASVDMFKSCTCGCRVNCNYASEQSWEHNRDLPALSAWPPAHSPSSSSTFPDAYKSTSGSTPLHMGNSSRLEQKPSELYTAKSDSTRRGKSSGGRSIASSSMSTNSSISSSTCIDHVVLSRPCGLSAWQHTGQYMRAAAHEVSKWWSQSDAQCVFKSYCWCVMWQNHDGPIDINCTGKQPYAGCTLSYCLGSG